jgi:type II secretion system protein G
MLGKLTNKKGFTLVELLIVIAILGVLVTVGLAGFRSSQARGRDAQRKSNLKQLSSALELYFSDYEAYPDASGGQIQGCGGNPCTWGAGNFTDGKTVYFKVVPKDPSDYSYFYRVPDPPNNQKFQLFAYLENTEDPSLITTPYSCGAETCNFSITSSNTTPSE